MARFTNEIPPLLSRDTQSLKLDELKLALRCFVGMCSEKDKPDWAGKVSGMSKRAAREQYEKSKSDIENCFPKPDEAGPSGNETSGEPANV